MTIPNPIYLLGRTNLPHMIDMCCSVCKISHLPYILLHTPRPINPYWLSTPNMNFCLYSRDNLLNIWCKATSLNNLPYFESILYSGNILVYTNISQSLSLLSCYLSQDMSGMCWPFHMSRKENSQRMCSCLFSHKIRAHNRINLFFDLIFWSHDNCHKNCQNYWHYMSGMNSDSNYTG